MHLAIQRTLNCFRPHSEIGAKLVPPNVGPIKPFLQCEQAKKRELPPKGLGIMKGFLQCESALLELGYK